MLSKYKIWISHFGYVLIAASSSSLWKKMVAKAIKHWCVGGQNSKIVRRPCVWRDLSNLWYPIHCQTSETDAKKTQIFFGWTTAYMLHTIWWCPKNTLMLELIMEMHGTEGHFESKKVLKCTFLNNFYAFFSNCSSALWKC